MKKIYLAFWLFVSPSLAFSQTLHAILVSDVEDRKLGGFSLGDEGRIMQVLKTAEWGTGLKLKTYYLNRTSFTAKAVRETLSQMRVGSRDVVFFYYSGLGYYPGQNDKFPTFKLKKNALQIFSNNNLALSLNEVGNILQNKGARLNVVMADCRDTDPGSLGIVAGPYIDEDVRQVFLKKLFLGSSGLVKIASAKEGQQVFALIYTRIFGSTFDNLLDSGFNGVRAATWPQFLKITESHPKSFGIDISNPASYKQTPVFDINEGTRSQRRNTTPYASYQHAMTAGHVSGALAVYGHEGGNYEELSDKISKAFRQNAKIELIRRNKYPASDARAKREVKEMSIEDYLAYFGKAAPLIKQLDTDLSSVKRTPNYEYITSLTIIETYDEL